jgi:hypothetical protein
VKAARAAKQREGEQMAHSLEAALVAAGLAKPIAHPAGRVERPSERETLPSCRGQEPSPLRRPNWLRHRQVGLSRHAIERYRERFTPELNHAAAQADLEDRLYGGPAAFSRERPRWLVHVAGRGERRPEGFAAGYVVLEDEIVLPIRETGSLADAEGWRPFQPFYVVTCLYREHLEGERLAPPSESLDDLSS